MENSDAKVLIVCADPVKTKEIEEFLGDLTRLVDVDSEVIAADNLLDAHEAFSANYRTLKIIFLDEEVPNHKSGSIFTFLNFVNSCGWRGLPIACSVNQTRLFNFGCQTYFGYNQIQSLTFNIGQYLKR